MSWEESRRKEQIFRKKRTNREVILKTVEQEDGKVTLSFSLRNNETSTELSLTVEEWKSILSFLKKTSEHILQEIDVKRVIPVAKPFAEAISEEISESGLEGAAIKLKEPRKMEGTPVASNAFDELASEINKVSPVGESAIPVVPSEQVIREVKAVLEKPANSAESPYQEADTQISEEELDAILEDEAVSEAPKIPVTEEDEPMEPSESSSIEEDEIIEPSIVESTAEEEIETLETNTANIETKEDLENQIAELIPIPTDLGEPETELTSERSELNEKTISSPPIPKIPSPSRTELESHLPPIQQPKLSTLEESEDTSPDLDTPDSMPPEGSSEPAPPTDLDQISAEELLDEAHRLETQDIMSEITPLLEKESVTLNLDEKEARIISAMEEVAALMPPGPAKKFVEDMMLKRAAEVQPRVPQKNED